MIYQQGKIYTIKPHRGKPFEAMFVGVENITTTLPMLQFERVKGNRKGSRFFIPTLQMKRTIRERKTR